MTEASKMTFEEINDALVDVFNNVMWIEEASLKASQFKDISIKDMHMIAAISMYDRKMASQVAEEVHLSPSATTSAIDKLVKKGYVERRRDENDRRVVFLSLTHRGRTVFRAHEAFHRALTHQLLAGANTNEQMARDIVVNLQNYLHALSTLGFG
ncbi:MarR family transcriptional regulator [Weissella oryzae SG25]|uniref:MarR family transcriptional regulator n=1 Tax=Weissella oryzae (strain DSM 25784 / JCM 18191 / LMG 30913 / SG25) TaxID=1329250 RepID=A0A069CW29_WEIOS|nr:MarR family transcriptional regulator [Weissella oryzae]GAK31674.1 MarR family transcriptional regulator [Weissella oryzae SG25]